jgi:hypothetical protein
VIERMGAVKKQPRSRARVIGATSRARRRWYRRHVSKPPPSPPLPLTKPSLLEIAARQLDPSYQPPPVPTAPAPTAPVPSAPVPSVPRPVQTRPVQTQPAVTPPPPAPSAGSDDQLVKDEFRVRFRRQLALIAIMLPAVWAAKLDSHELRSPREIVGVIVIFAGFILTLINWRCPRCNRYLYRRLYPSSCPRCGVTFHD